MLTRIEALRYRCLRDIDVSLGGLQVMVGPNASGKSTFLDVVGFISDLLQLDLESALERRAPSFSDLVWMHENRDVQLGLELEIPEDRIARLPQNGVARARYELALGVGEDGIPAILNETLWLIPPRDPAPQGELEFPRVGRHRDSIVVPDQSRSPSGWKKVVTKKHGGNDYFMSETTKWNNPFRLGPRKLALSGLPEDAERFPVATWVRRVLAEGISALGLDSRALRRAAPPLRKDKTHLRSDGSNLPWVVRGLRTQDPAAHEQWVRHVRTALPDLAEIKTTVREDDKHCYLTVVYDSGLEAPSWTVSDGTLRMLALTLLAYLPPDDLRPVYLVEEPENGIHPQAVEAVTQALASSYDRQILCATHSPVMVAQVEPRQMLCFARDEHGAADVIRGDQHPRLKEWQRDVDLGTLFAAGVLQ